MVVLHDLLGVGHILVLWSIIGFWSLPTDVLELIGFHFTLVYFTFLMDTKSAKCCKLNGWYNGVLYWLFLITFFSYVLQMRIYIIHSISQTISHSNAQFICLFCLKCSRVKSGSVLLHLQFAVICQKSIELICLRLWLYAHSWLHSKEVVH